MFKRNITLVSMAIIALIYTTTLLIYNYKSQSKIQETTLSQWKDDIASQANFLSYFYKERKYEVSILSESHVIKSYFENKALGMSMQYGLALSLDNIEKKIVEFLNTRKGIYEGLAFYDYQDKVLIHKHTLNAKLCDIEKFKILNKIIKTPELKSIVIDKEQGIYIQAPCFFKGRAVGQIVAKTSCDFVRSHILDHKEDSYDQFVSTVSGNSYFYLSEDLVKNLPQPDFFKLNQIKTFSLQIGSGQIDMLGIIVPVKGTHLKLVGFISRHKLLGSVAPWHTLAVMVIFLLLIIGGCLTLMQANTRNQLLRGRFEEAAKSRDLAEQASRSKSEFLANMSHEIRTPMNGVLGMVQLLETTDLSKEQLEYVRPMRVSAERLLVIINDILDLSKIEAGKLDVQPEAVNLRLLVEQIISFVGVNAKEKNLDILLEWHSDTPRWVMVDGVRLAQVLTNLCSNAIKFTAKGWVKIYIKPLSSPAKDRVQLEFRVEDSGVGIEDDKLQLIFQSFSQADGSISRRFGGTGLGLTISNHLVKLMGGDPIAVQSRKGQGSVFSFRLFLQKSQPTQAEENKDDFVGRENLAEKIGQLRVLVAEDNKMNQLLLKKILKKFAISQALMVENGLKAWQTLAEDVDWDLVLMDVQMPEMDGITATRKIREAGIDIPVYALTAHAMGSDKDKCLAAGMNGYISKPYKLGELLDIFSTVVEQKERR